MKKTTNYSDYSKNKNWPQIKQKPEYQHAPMVSMKKEKATLKLYMDIAEAANDENICKFFLVLAQEEAKYKLRFEVKYDEIIMKEDWEPFKYHFLD